MIPLSWTIPFSTQIEPEMSIHGYVHKRNDGVRWQAVLQQWPWHLSLSERLLPFKSKVHSNRSRVWVTAHRSGKDFHLYSRHGATRTDGRWLRSGASRFKRNLQGYSYFPLGCGDHSSHYSRHCHHLEVFKWNCLIYWETASLTHTESPFSALCPRCLRTNYFLVN